ncbi:uncharacterized protein LOC134291262 [Aedes albopictus]|uniref:C2H2-type domain-containing protein n=1 Tax=Aedes albopictus TaxID=7160 RepID=A0ABM1YZZ3_AEDAL
MHQMGPTICIACRSQGYGMISIHHHPNELDKKFQFTTGIEVVKGDHLCVACYDELKIAYNFKQKSVRNNMNIVKCVHKENTVVESQSGGSMGAARTSRVADMDEAGSSKQGGNPEVPQDKPVEAEARCEVCNKTFRKTRLLRAHMMTHHQTEESLNLSKFYSIIM